MTQATLHFTWRLLTAWWLMAWWLMAWWLTVLLPLGCSHAVDDTAAAEQTYVCPMHPQVRQSAPGSCPICHMDLVPLSQTTTPNGDVVVHGAEQRQFGVRTSKVVRGTLQRSVKAPGRVAFDGTRVVDVTLRAPGYITRMFADAEGARVKRGQPVLWLESPELVLAQEELLRADVDSPLRAAAARRLLLLGLVQNQIDELIATHKPLSPVPVVADADGVVTIKDVVVGQRVEAGMRAVRIAEPDRLWIEAELFFFEAEAAQPGRRAAIASLDGSINVQGVVARVLPDTDAASRTLRVRIDVNSNAKPDTKDKKTTSPQPALVPGAAVVVTLLETRAPALLVPKDAVIPTGNADVVFVKTSDDNFVLRQVQRGQSDATHSEILSGLTENEEVVDRAAFLLASESRLRAPQVWRSEPVSAP